MDLQPRDLGRCPELAPAKAREGRPRRAQADTDGPASGRARRHATGAQTDIFEDDPIVDKTTYYGDKENYFPTFAAAATVYGQNRGKVGESAREASKVAHSGPEPAQSARPSGPSQPLYMYLFEKSAWGFGVLGLTPF